MKKYFYLVSYIVPISTYLSLASTGVMTFAAAMVSFGIIPLLELIIPESKYNFSQEEEDQALDSKFYDYLVYSMVPIQYFLLLFFSYQISRNTYTSLELFGITFSMGISCGVIGINVGHELGHRVKKSEQLMAKLLLATSWYSHFFVEHNKGHHRHVSTDKDPASAIKGQALYSFWITSTIGSLKSAIKISKKEVMKWKGIELLLTLLILGLFGLKSALCFLIAALVGALLLESVNYIEHYGLRRKVNPSGRYEKVTPAHSWNSDHPLGRLVLFNLSRHSDHHANVNRKYQVLRTFKDESPQFPTGYSGMIILSVIPPLWFKIMNKRVDKIMS